jgi:hypothetical protein
MTAVTARTPAEMVAEADFILGAAGPGPWRRPKRRFWQFRPTLLSAHAQRAVGYAYDRADECRVIYGRLVNGDLRPDRVNPPDLLPGDPDEHAEEWAADEYLEAAKTARNRLAEWQRKEGGRSWPAS